MSDCASVAVHLDGPVIDESVAAGDTITQVGARVISPGSRLSVHPLSQRENGDDIPNAKMIDIDIDHEGVGNELINSSLED